MSPWRIHQGSSDCTGWKQQAAGSRSPEQQRPGADTAPTSSPQPRFACEVLIKFDCRHGLCCTALVTPNLLSPTAVSAQFASALQVENGTTMTAAPHASTPQFIPVTSERYGGHCQPSRTWCRSSLRCLRLLRDGETASLRLHLSASRPPVPPHIPELEQRKPRVLPRPPGWKPGRYAARTCCAEPPQLPPRITRNADESPTKCTGSVT